jgi:hypothetical protein
VADPGGGREAGDSGRVGRAEAAELELERAHRFLDACGVPREFRRDGERDPAEYSLEGRLRLALEDED